MYLSINLFEFKLINRRNLKISALVNIEIAFGGIISCNNNDSTDTSCKTLEVPAVYKRIYGATSITTDATYINIKTKDLPDHKSAFYSITNALNLILIKKIIIIKYTL